MHILDHLDEIDRRSLALQRGFSSLFDYAVRELRISDAAAQRRIQTMRLCRRHGWVRAMLHSGDLSLTAAAQMETAFAAAERQSRRARPAVGLEQCHDLPRLPGSPSATGATCGRDAGESGAGAGVAGAVAMTASAAHGVVAAGQEARLSGDAGGHEHGHTGSDRGRPSSEQPAAAAARPAAAGAQPVGRLESSIATAGVTPPSMPGHAKCRGETSAPEWGVESQRGGESREAGSKHVPDMPDSDATTLHAPQQAAPRRAPRTGLAGEGLADTPVVRAAEHAPDRSAALPDGRQAHHVAAVVARAASHGAVRHRGSPHAELPARMEAIGAAATSPAPSRAAGPAALSSDQRLAAPPLPLTNRATPVPSPVVAPAEPPPTAAALAPEPSQGDPIAELSAGPVSAAALLNPQRQREIIEQAAGMTTRQVAGLLATAAPEVVPPRDTLRAVAPDRFTLKVNIDRQCEQGLRQLKDLRSHLDPRMSWGDLVALLVREALARHDPRGGGRRSRRADRKEASPRRRRSRTPAVVRPAARAAADDGDTPAPQGETAVAREQPRAAMSPNAAPVRGSAPAAPATGATPAGAKAPGTRSSAAAAAAAATLAAATAPAVESHPARSAPEPAAITSAAAAAPEGQSAGARVTCPSPRAPAPGAPRPTVPAAPANGAPQTGPSGTPEAAAAPKFACAGSAGGSVAVPVPQSAAPAPKSGSRGAAAGSDAAPVPQDTPPAPMFGSGGTVDGTDIPPVSPCAAPAPKFASGSPADAPGAALIPPDAHPASQLVGGAATVGAEVPVLPPATPAREVAGGVPLARGAGGTRTESSPQSARDAPRGPRRTPVRRPIPAAVRRHVWLRDGGRCCYRDPLTGRRCNSSHLLQIDHLLPVAEGGGPEPENLALRCFAHHRMRHGYGPAVPAEPAR